MQVISSIFVRRGNVISRSLIYCIRALVSTETKMRTSYVAPVPGGFKKARNKTNKKKFLECLHSGALSPHIATIYFYLV